MGRLTRLAYAEKVMPRAPGEGSIVRLRDGRWRVRIRRNGKERSWQFRDHKSAIAKLRELQTKTDPIRTVTRQTVGQWCIAWLADVAIEHPRTHESYVEKMAHAIPLLGDMRLADVGREDVRNVIASCLAKGLSNTTTRHVHQTMFTMFHEAQKKGLISENPAHDVPRPRRDHFEAQTLTPNQMVRLAIEAENDAMIGTLVLVAMATGVRQGELLALTWDDVDFDNHILSVTKSVRAFSGRVEVGPPKTRSGRRHIPLDAAIEHFLKMQRLEVNAMQVFAKHWHDHNLVFPAKDGTHRTWSGAMNRHWRHLLSRAQVPRIRFHDLRHTVGLMITRAQGVVVASRILGHADPGITARYYGHAQASDLKQAAERLAAAMFDRPPTTPSLPDSVRPVTSAGSNG